MNTRTILSLGLSALVMGGTMVGCTAGASRMASVASRADRDAATKLAKAEKLLAKGKADEAIEWAESAVALDGKQSRYRYVLGQAYLKAGRFTSAHQAFADALTLAPANGRAALNLALAAIAEGQWDTARTTLAAHRDAIAPADYGLALALAGDPAGAVEQLAALVASPQADAKARQNLALAHALAGNWQAAKSVAQLDLSPLDADKRIMEWATFARPGNSSAQVAALLGVTPVADAGQPVALALAAPAPVAVAQAEAPAAVAPVATPPVAPTPDATPAPAANIAAMAAVEKPAPILSVPTTIKARGAFKTKLDDGSVATSAPAAWQPQAGGFYVQLGAYENAAVARDAWGRLSRRHASLKGRTPNGMAFASRGGDVYRLSVGGFVRGDADRLCRTVRAKGGACFVRAGAGDQLASWLRTATPVRSAAVAKKGVQLAAR